MFEHEILDEELDIAESALAVLEIELELVAAIELLAPDIGTIIVRTPK